MSRSSQQFEETVADLLWSLWAEFGVSGVVPPWHRDQYIDPEALVLFTAAASDLDLRLRDEAIDWLIRYGTQLSKARLKNLRAAWHLRDDPNVARFVATVNAHAPLRWPTEGRPLSFEPRGHVVLEDLFRPSLIALRTRAVFGVGARAELIRTLLGQSHFQSAAALAAETGYGKRNVLNALDAMRSARLIEVGHLANAAQYRLLHRSAVLELVGPIPSLFPRWYRILPIVLQLLRLVRDGADRSALENAVAARRFADTGTGTLREAGLVPPSLPTGLEAWPALLDWADQSARSLGQAQPSS